MSELRFYIDENVQVAVAEQLLLQNIDAVSAHSLDQLGDTDMNHLQRATSMGRILCTHDQDFLKIAAEGISHAGIAFAPQSQTSIGGWVRALRAIHAKINAEEVIDQVIFLSLR